MYTSTGAEQKQAQTVLSQFQEHPEAWQRVPAILQGSGNGQTKVSREREVFKGMKEGGNPKEPRLEKE